MLRQKTIDSPPPPQVYLAAFGKHPGWDDHIDDLGVETESLAAIKRAIYTEGVGVNVDSGAWEAIDEARRVERFHHAFVQLAAATGPDAIVGRLWSSSDGKGRTRYPMVVCAQATGVALDWLVSQAMPLLARLEQQCAATKSAADVRHAVDQARNSLRDALAGAGARAWESAEAINSLKRLVRHPAMGPQQQGLLRMLYQIEREMAAYRPLGSGTSTSRIKGSVQRAQQIRVPKCGEGDVEEALLWMAFMLTQVHGSVPVLVLEPLEQPWVDVIVGEPAAAQLFCLRAGPHAMPLVTEIPFTLEKDFVERTCEFISKASASEGVSFSVAAPVSASKREPRLLQRLLGRGS